jgi:uncharacterized protein YjbJ (UPF0337 family)
MAHEDKDLGTQGKEDTLKGKLDQALGKGQEKVGQVSANPDLEARGDVNQASGATQATYGNAEQHVDHTLDHQSANLGAHGTEHTAKGGLNKVVGKIEEKIGELTDNPKLEAKGKAKQVGGTVESKFGQAEQKVGDALDPHK